MTNIFFFKAKGLTQTGRTVLAMLLVFIQGAEVFGQKNNGQLSVQEQTQNLIAVEAENLFKQTHTVNRKWQVFPSANKNKEELDQQSNMLRSAHNASFIQVLPDSRLTHSDSLVRGVNFSNKPGTVAVAHYKVMVNEPGRYYVWVRAFSSGSEDNSVHVGVDGTWPESGQRMQWCEGKNQWTWESKQRTKKNHCGVPYAIYLDIENPGVHEVMFSMREDGFAMDSFLLTKDKNYKPSGDITEDIVVAKAFSAKPEKQVIKQKSYLNRVAEALAENKVIPAQSFPVGEKHFYKNGKRWLAIDPKKHKKATTTQNLEVPSGFYDLLFVGVGENDGQSEFEIFLNEKLVGSYKPPRSKELFEEGAEYNFVAENIKVKQGDKVTVVARIGSDGVEWTRGRWAGIILTPSFRAKEITDKPSSYTSK